jgi:hypothetical protein
MSCIHTSPLAKQTAKELINHLNEMLRKYNANIDFDNNVLSFNQFGYAGKLQDNFDSISLFEAFDLEDEVLCISESPKDE